LPFAFVILYNRPTEQPDCANQHTRMHGSANCSQFCAFYQNSRHAVHFSLEYI